MKTFQVFLLCILGIGLTLSSCQRDDICAESTPTTPRLIIRFYDNLDSQDLKPVVDLTVRATSVQDSIILNENGDLIVTTDSIAIPLNSANTTTRFILTRNAGSETNENSDTIEFIYTPVDVYVNRACGFRANFLDTEFEFDTQDSNNWINRIELIEPNITDELSAHVNIFH